MAARTSENPPQIGAAAPQHASPEAGDPAAAEPTAANRAVGSGAASRRAEPACQGSCKTSPKPPATTPKPPPPKTPEKPTDPTGAIFPAGRAATACPPCRRTRKSSGLYVAACASGAITGKPDSVATLERRISALRWQFAQRGETFDRADRHVATVLAGVRRTQGRPPEQKEAILPDDLKAMIATLDLGDLSGLRDRAILLLGFAGGLRRSEIVGLDRGARQTQDGTGWTEILDEGILVTLRGKTGWREVEIGRGSRELSCPVVALEAWLKFARIEHGPLFRRVIGKTVGPERLADKHVARLVKRAALAAGVRGDLVEGERARKFSGHSLRAGLASSAEIDERFVQKQLGHASAEMTRRYQRRRDRFRVNLTKAAGL